MKVLSDETIVRSQVVEKDGGILYRSEYVSGHVLWGGSASINFSQQELEKEYQKLINKDKPPKCNGKNPHN